MQRELIRISNVNAKKGGLSALRNINLVIREKETWAIAGDSGSGKTTFAQVLVGSIFYSGTVQFSIIGSIELVEQQHRFKTLSNTSDFYYQQRFQSQDAGDSLTIQEELQPFFDERPEETFYTIRLLHLEHLLEEPMIQLSNGENKRLQIVKALLKRPALLILDNPFVGLDTDGRALLHTIINKIAVSGVPLILITSAHEIPDQITHIAELNSGELVFTGTKKEFENTKPFSGETAAIDDRLFDGIQAAAHLPFEYAVKMKDVTIRYGEKTILEGINWEVKKGERWSLSGPNGAGKSTLLSLVNADNPQAYANEIWLFDRRRGRGESIWDIKRNIGYVSPEMHLYFPYTSTCLEVIASGLFDTVGLFRQLTGEQELQAARWVNLLKLDAFAAKPLQQLSLGHQRMALLARALVKNPPLLVLDEPCQGLDDEQTRFFNCLIDKLCVRFNTTLVYVSHYSSHLPRCINRRLSLQQGRAREETISK